MATMADTALLWPEKTAELQNEMMDSTRWNELAWRSDDIVIASWGKAGTTWVQQIVAQLIYEGEDVPVGEISPWLEFVMFPKDMVLSGLASQDRRRFIKTHLPVSALGLRPDVKYLYVARDGRDVVFSMHPFLSGFDGPREVAGGPRMERPPISPDIAVFFREWLAGDRDVLAPFFPNIRGWWDARHLPNVKLLHYNKLKADMAGEIAGIAEFLGIEPSEAAWPRILEHCGFDYMKRNAEAVGPLGARNLVGGSASFFHKGSNGRWREVLTDQDIAAYEQAVAANLDPDCARWLATGEMS